MRILVTRGFDSWDIIGYLSLHDGVDIPPNSVFSLGYTILEGTSRHPTKIHVQQISLISDADFLAYAQKHKDEEEKNRMAQVFLHQIVAVEKDHKDKASQQLSHAQGLLSNSGKLTGIARSYTPRDENGAVLPSESTRVQVKAAHVVKDLQAHLASLFDVVATKDYTNCLAKADIVVDGHALLTGVPATYILFLEKQLAELLAFVKKIPALDPARSWSHDESQDCWVSPPEESIRTKKTKKAQTVFEGNQYHKPEFLVFDEDIPEGTWSTLHYSGAMQQSEINAIIARIETLQKAVKFAREHANRQEVTQQRVGESVLKYVFG